MKNILYIAKKELWSYFTNLTGYIFMGLLLLVANFIFFQDFFVLGQANLEPLWGTLGLLMSLFVPAAAMNLIAEEKKNGTWEVLLSLPVSENELVIGKFLGSMGFLVLAILLTLPTVVTVVMLGQPDIGLIVSGMVGMILLAAAYLSVGIFSSSLSNQPVVGFLIALVVLLANSLLGQDTVLTRLPVGVKEVVAGLSISWHSNLFSSGLFRLTDIVFFGSWIFVFLLLTVLTLKARNK